jgi:hypothetical protein
VVHQHLLCKQCWRLRGLLLLSLLLLLPPLWLWLLLLCIASCLKSNTTSNTPCCLNRLCC